MNVIINVNARRIKGRKFNCRLNRVHSFAIILHPIAIEESRIVFLYFIAPYLARKQTRSIVYSIRQRNNSVFNINGSWSQYRVNFNGHPNLPTVLGKLCFQALMVHIPGSETYPWAVAVVQYVLLLFVSKISCSEPYTPSHATIAVVQGHQNATASARAARAERATKRREEAAANTFQRIWRGKHQA